MLHQMQAPRHVRRQVSRYVPIETLAHALLDRGYTLEHATPCFVAGGGGVLARPRDGVVSIQRSNLPERRAQHANVV
jgi:hypothetical protein